jgi:arylsulfatase B
MDMYPDQPKNTQAFFGMITNIDDNVAKTRALLKELGVHENTIFIFTTDNGTAGGAKIHNAGMRGQKGSEYDGGHRVPFFLHWPAGGMDKEHTVKQLTGGVDIVPTLLDLTGSTKPDDLKFDGVSIRKLLEPDTEVQWLDRMLITDSQRVVDPVKWRKSAVMSQQYRLINGEELYDITKDPGQKNDIAKDHPEQVAKMRAFYEAWWAELEPTFAQTTEIYLGQPGHEKVTLTSHDWIGTSGVPWNQGHIRRTLANPRKKKPYQHNSHWAVKVITPGNYEISVRRWPEEANKPITASLPPGAEVPGSSRAFRATDGVQIAAKHAVLRIDGKEIGKKAVPEGATEVTFTTDLKPGSLKLSPIFLTDSGEVGAYYTIVTKK